MTKNSSRQKEVLGAKLVYEYAGFQYVAVAEFAVELRVVAVMYG